MASDRRSRSMETSGKRCRIVPSVKGHRPVGTDSPYGLRTLLITQPGRGDSDCRVPQTWRWFRTKSASTFPEHTSWRIPEDGEFRLPGPTCTCCREVE